jgi:hypothetical protein
MTTIDVNTGGFVGLRATSTTPSSRPTSRRRRFIARQLRLRNLGGIIIVDFIDMDSEEHRDAVLAELNKALARDHTRMTVNGFTALGLVEMTRKRTRESLAHVLCEPCPTCGGRGEVKTARTMCYEILRELLREARQFNAREFRILGRARRDRPLPRRGIQARSPCCRTSSASRFPCRPNPATRRSSSTSSSCNPLPRPLSRKRARGSATPSPLWGEGWGEGITEESMERQRQCPAVAVRHHGGCSPSGPPACCCWRRACAGSSAAASTPSSRNSTPA